MADDNQLDELKITLNALAEQQKMMLERQDSILKHIADSQGRSKKTYGKR